MRGFYLSEHERESVGHHCLQSINKRTESIFTSCSQGGPTLDGAVGDG